jgi:hypothetical protein
MKKVARVGNKVRFPFRTKFQKSTPMECSFFCINCWSGSSVGRLFHKTVADPILGGAGDQTGWTAQVAQPQLPAPT